ncbi:hypothetical protein EN836_02120 [Mesorhizobium sp. M1C.F.Ca.ET.193.01.1.1]|uniref:hypothetical protein n=1 Tax=unclassified Mesorhizobium TaxID=325217 RepID=UPI000FD26F09|nr:MULTISPECIES: hypothetical protein [unclassified Mesorhizobium]TGT04887.1 hypothetical protein EN820_16365 [bacterium M00.F.Ca.ET.177.01.1.1]TGQ57715.1 hypothetical protein EN853_02115 [Mesorhizobium sp. M1C.F.Ca.ET.210.01.1.1]TGQ76173.1 hypothetical protein EN855_002120 [Mesorhizobium sp. M1C.F.Ca.ET.212.01.1.1]TGR14557.1 hypothetical protein EN847_02120 [Mesorhizobium sp. M1C.F.Ca.ET.204.01.1.1]TGR35721.1 hypothetical protein EN839_02120 [Mesorhizobium sp. M1C.F.Ca.ET.196.01.1.1]
MAGLICRHDWQADEWIDRLDWPTLASLRRPLDGRFIVLSEQESPGGTDDGGRRPGEDAGDIDVAA